MVARTTRPSRVRPRRGLPDGRSRHARGGRLRDRQERDQHPAAGRYRPGRQHEHLAGAWFFADQPPATYDPAKAIEILEAGGWTDSDGDGVREKDGLKAIIELCTTTRQVRQDTLALIADWLKAVGIQGIPNAVSPDDIFATTTSAPETRPACCRSSNYDLAEHAFSSSIDPIGNYFNYHSTQFQPDGANDAQVKNAESTPP